MVQWYWHFFSGKENHFSVLCWALQTYGIRCCWLNVYNLKGCCILVAHTWLNFESHIPYAWSKGPVIQASLSPSPTGMDTGNQRNIKRHGKTIKACWCCRVLYWHSRPLTFKVLKAEFPQPVQWLMCKCMTRGAIFYSNILQQALLSVEGISKTRPPWFPF